MKKFVPILSVGCLSLLLNSCGLFSSSEQAQKTTPAPVEVAPPPPTPPKATSQPIETVSVGEFSLIPSTSSSQRRQEIKTGRPDPFAVFPLQPVVSIAKSADGKAIEDLCKIEPKPSGEPETITTYIEVPAPPIPNEARGVLVSGVVRTSQVPIAIVKAPSEPLARQVLPGTTLANGLVQVKAIDTSSDIPTVVLEQYGRQIVRSVGQEAEPPLPPSPPIKIPVTKTLGLTTTPRGPDAYGRAKNVLLLDLTFQKQSDQGKGYYASSGVVCNSGTQSLKVSSLKFQVQDKKNSNVLSTFRVSLGDNIDLEPGQKAEFSGGGYPNLRGRNPKDVSFIFKSWSNNPND